MPTKKKTPAETGVWMHLHQFSFLINVKVFLAFSGMKTGAPFFLSRFKKAFS
jgi:hypothetical protein